MPHLLPGWLFKVFFLRRRSRPGPDVPRFPRDKLARIQAALEGQGVSFIIGDDGETLARGQHAEALYMATGGEPGIVVLAKMPSRAAVVEELLHLGQHRRMGWPEPNDRRRPFIEIEAQDRLIALARRKGWTRGEVHDLQRARRFWVAEAQRIERGP